jgi:hypothetical protein
LVFLTEATLSAERFETEQFVAAFLLAVSVMVPVAAVDVALAEASSLELAATSEIESLAAVDFSMTT